MTAEERPPAWVINPNTPSVARMYDYYLGGKDNFAADRAAAHRVMEAMLAERRTRPGTDLVSAMLAARDGDAALTEPELLSSIMLLLIAGHETTVNLIGNGMLALLRAPGQLKLLRERPELIPGAVEKLLRYDGPVERASQRITLEDMEIAGTAIPKGAWVHISLGAAGRDPAVFEAPDTLDVTRTAGRHVAFGHGLHFCLGAPLARLEGQVALAALLDRFPDLALAVPPEQLKRHRNGSIVRGLVSLPIHPGQPPAPSTQPAA